MPLGDFMSLIKNFSICFSLLLLYCSVIPLPAWSSEYFLQQEEVTKILKLFAFTSKEETIAKKWDNYLIERTRFCNEEYKLAIHELKSEFDQSYSRLNSCIKNVELSCMHDSLSWLNDFQNKFGTEYIRDNFISIKYVILATAMADNLSPCQEQIKEALYREYRQLDAIKIYVEDFIAFSKSLSKDEKSVLDSRVKAAEAFLAGFAYPLQGLWSYEGLRSSLFTAALKTRKDLNPQVIDFFSHNPGFMKQCLPQKAINALQNLK